MMLAQKIVITLTMIILTIPAHVFANTDTHVVEPGGYIMVEGQSLVLTCQPNRRDIPTCQYSEFMDGNFLRRTVILENKLLGTLSEIYGGRVSAKEVFQMLLSIGACRHSTNIDQSIREEGCGGVVNLYGGDEFNYGDKNYVCLDTDNSIATCEISSAHHRLYKGTCDISLSRGDLSRTLEYGNSINACEQAYDLLLRSDACEGEERNDEIAGHPNTDSHFRRTTMSENSSPGAGR